VKLALIGLGNAGGKIVDELIRHEAELSRSVVESAVAINTARVDLARLDQLPRENRFLVGQTHEQVKGHGAGGDPDLGANVIRSDQAEIDRALDRVPPYEVDAFWIVAGLGGGTGSGGAPVVAEQVAAWELGKEIPELDYAERKRVYTSLQQTHLPRLDDAGMIKFENGRVETTDQVEQLEVYMDIVPEDSLPWGEYYLGLSVLGVGIIGGAGVGVLPTSLISELGWALVFLAVLLSSAAYHVYQNRRNRLGSMDQPPSAAVHDE